MSEPDHKPDGSGLDDGPWLPGKGPRAKPDAQAVFPGDAFVGHPLDAKLEDETRNMRGDAAALYSIAISLKRIADALEHSDDNALGIKRAISVIADRAHNGWGPSS